MAKPVRGLWVATCRVNWANTAPYACRCSSGFLVRFALVMHTHLSWVSCAHATNPEPKCTSESWYMVQCANAPMWTNVPIQCQSQSNVPMWTNRIGQSNSYPIHVAIPIHAMWHYQCQFAIVSISYHGIHVRLRLDTKDTLSPLSPITKWTNESNQFNKNQWANGSCVGASVRARMCQ